MKTILTDCSSFERIISGGSIYVDKTDLLYRLVTGGGSRFFIARPRRFGKSLMISTLEALFKGRRDLFDGLKISGMDYGWPTYPVIHLDMSAVVAEDAESVKKNIVVQVQLLAARHGVQVNALANETPSACFSALLAAVAEKKGRELVVLIDEYDAPVNRLIEEERDSRAVSSILHDFYMQLKVNDGNIRFLLMTGVSKFAKLSVFSGLNNLTDLTLEPECADLLGYTVPEIKMYFKEHIAAFARELAVTGEEVLEQLLDWYDGYRFSPHSDLKVTNPVSLASALTRRRFEAFWDETGQSSLIYMYFQRRCIVPSQLEGVAADSGDLNFCDINNVASPALLFQTGYLTIKDVRTDGRLVFGIPNREVKGALEVGMMSYIFREKKSEVLSGIRNAKEKLALNPGSAARIVGDMLTAAFKAVPYDDMVKGEPEARRMFIFYCNLMGADVVGEQHSSFGRSDVVLRLEQAVFIFEFKYGHTAEMALQQAISKDYAGPFANGNKPVYLVGVNYNPKIRNIDPPKSVLWGGHLEAGLAATPEVGASGATGPYQGESTANAIRDVQRIGDAVGAAVGLIAGSDDHA